MQYICFKATSNDNPLLRTKNFFDFFGYFFVKQSGGSSMEPTGMDDNWLTMEARLRLRTKDHTWG